MNEIIQQILDLCRLCDNKRQCGFGHTCKAQKKRIIAKNSQGWMVARQQCSILDEAAKTALDAPTTLS